MAVPYAAVQVQNFHTSNYAETDLTAGGFGLAYNAMNAIDTRSELGACFDNLTVLGITPLILRARLAWAHDWNSNSALDAAFQTLPGSTFIVNGAAPPKDPRLLTWLRNCGNFDLGAYRTGRFRHGIAEIVGWWIPPGLHRGLRRVIASPLKTGIAGLGGRPVDVGFDP